MKRIVWDHEECTGCRVCEAVCSLTKSNYQELNPVKARCRIVRTSTGGFVTNTRVSCLQCEDAYCMDVCPVGAISKNTLGVNIVDEEVCIGCKMCEMACPVGAISVSKETGVSQKCDQCLDLEEPACVSFCFVEALHYLDDAKIGAWLARKKAGKFAEMERKEFETTLKLQKGGELHGNI